LSMPLPLYLRRSLSACIRFTGSLAFRGSHRCRRRSRKT